MLLTPKELPRGINKVKNGYEVRKIHNKVLYNSSFTNQALTDDEKLQLAINHLNQLQTSWKQIIQDSVKENVQRLSVSRSNSVEDISNVPIEYIDDLD